MPSIAYHDASLATPPHDSVILTESAIVAHFLADLHPSHLLPEPKSPQGALKRARIGFFHDTWATKCNSLQYKVILAADEEEKQARADEFIASIKKEIEPLLADAAPFFGGSDKITMAEVRCDTIEALLSYSLCLTGDGSAICLTSSGLCRP